MITLKSLFEKDLKKNKDDFNFGKDDIEYSCLTEEENLKAEFICDYLNVGKSENMKKYVLKAYNNFLELKKSVDKLVL